ncbi:hypothetical protein [Yoonia sp. SDW83-1]|uniref:hypothetical protein n=1 Tax=Yoonia sp. SDW83-1 TaxID=3366945 RepID=UPI00398C605B
MDFETLTRPEPIPGDEHGFADSAFQRVAAVCRHGDIESVEEFRSFLEAEAAECDRQATYLRGMTKYFHENAAIGQELEAKALRVMLNRAG